MTEVISTKPSAYGVWMIHFDIQPINLNNMEQEFHLVDLIYNFAKLNTLTQFGIKKTLYISWPGCFVKQLLRKINLDFFLNQNLITKIIVESFNFLHTFEKWSLSSN
jgi:hypothetical protein